MSFFDYQGILESLLRVKDAVGRTYRRKVTHSLIDEDDDSDGSSEASADEAFEDDIDTLRDYMFISIAPGEVHV